MFRNIRICCCLLTALSVSACAAQSTSHCLVADTVSIIDEKAGSYLVYRVNGLQEKQEFFEVYDSKPTFDSCGISDKTAVAQEPYFRSDGFLKGVRYQHRQLSILYTKIAARSIKPESVRFSH